MAFDNGKYRGVIWPIKMLPDGNLLTGTRSETIRSDIRMIFSTRRFVSGEIGGDRLMRPGFGTIFCNQLLKRFDDDIQIPVFRSEVVTSLRILEEERLIRILEIGGHVPQDGAIQMQIAYFDLVENYHVDYEFEVGTELPRTSLDRR